MFMLRKLMIVFVLGALAAAPAQAQKPGVRDEVMERIRALRIARLIEALDLDEHGAARLTPILDRSYGQIAAVAKDSGQARRELKGLVAAEHPDDARINQIVDHLLANKLKIDELENQMIGDIRKVLTAAQVARLVVVLPEINHQIQQQIRNAVRPGNRNDVPQRPGRGNPGAEDPF